MLCPTFCLIYQNCKHSIWGKKKAKDKSSNGELLAFSCLCLQLNCCFSRAPWKRKAGANGSNWELRTFVTRILCVLGWMLLLTHFLSSTLLHAVSILQIYTKNNDVYKHLSCRPPKHLQSKQFCKSWRVQIVIFFQSFPPCFYPKLEKSKYIGPLNINIAQQTEIYVSLRDIQGNNIKVLSLSRDTN